MSRGGFRNLRFVVLASLLILVIYKLSTGRVVAPDPLSQQPWEPDVQSTTGGVGETKKSQQDLDVQTTINVSQSIDSYNRANATFITLARNSDLWDLVESIRNVEDRFNDKYHYDWVFLNEEEFSDEFKEITSAFVSGQTHYGLIPEQHWGFPDWIDKDKAAETRENMKHIIYGDSISYRHMCRYESGFFWRHPLMNNYKYYWRVEPGVRLFCDIDYDLFKYMEQEKYRYGFTVSLYEYHDTVPTLWDTTKEFLENNPQYVANDPLLDFVSDDGGETFNLCHFWSNFEVADMDFWRDDAYREYFDYLDKTGGFFYERWGDAPVHSIAASLFLNRTEIHHFEDVGYMHSPYTNCPTEESERIRLRCTCRADDNFSWRGYSCTPKYYKVNNFPPPKGWTKQADDDVLRYLADS